MSILVGKSLVGRLTARFSLKQVNEPITVDPKVILTSSVDDLVRRTKVVVAGPISITGTGNFRVHTCPLRVRQRILGAFIFLGTGTYTMNQLFGVSQDLNDNGVLLLATQTPAVSLSIYPATHRPIPLNPGWWLMVNIDAHSVTGNLYANIMMEEEDID